MAIKRLGQTLSSFSKDKPVNRAEQVRRDNDIIKTPKCTIEDVDWAILSYIRDVIQPTVIENDKIITIVKTINPKNCLTNSGKSLILFI